jgi:hypothetical protein
LPLPDLITTEKLKPATQGDTPASGSKGTPPGNESANDFCRLEQIW